MSAHFKALILSFIFVLSWSPAINAAQKSPRAYNQVALEIPFDGGGMLMFSRMWVLGKYFEAGFSAGGGLIEREFDMTVNGDSNWEGETKSLVLPFVGPRVTAFYHFIGLSVGYGLFYSDTDIDVRSPAGEKFTGNKKGWGTGFYSPLLVLSYYNPDQSVVYGIGLGGFFGTSYPDLTAHHGGTRVVTNENPIDTFTLHMSLSFGPKSWKKDLSEDW